MLRGYPRLGVYGLVLAVLREEFAVLEIKPSPPICKACTLTKCDISLVPVYIYLTYTSNHYSLN